MAGQEALGFIFGGAVAFKLKKGFVPIRKGGGLPTISSQVLRATFVDYSKKKKTLEMNRGSVKKGERILLVDDWIETGQQMRAAVRLVERQEGVISAIAALSMRRKGNEDLLKKYHCLPLHLYNS